MCRGKWEAGLYLMLSVGLPIFSILPGKYLDKIATQIRTHNINAILIIGGFEVGYFFLEPAH